jgi:hypothetical protein
VKVSELHYEQHEEPSSPAARQEAAERRAEAVGRQDTIGYRQHALQDWDARLTHAAKRVVNEGAGVTLLSQLTAAVAVAEEALAFREELKLLKKRIESLGKAARYYQFAAVVVDGLRSEIIAQADCMSDLKAKIRKLKEEGKVWKLNQWI